MFCINRALSNSFIDCVELERLFNKFFPFDLSKQQHRMLKKIDQGHI